MNALLGYESKAKRIAKSIGLAVEVSRHPEGGCPPWGGGACDHAHGDRYRIRLKRGGRSIGFDFWNSRHDSERGERPGYYSILACVASDASGPTDPDEIAAEYGPMRPSQAIAVARHSARLRAFLTEREIERLGEVDR